MPSSAYWKLLRYLAARRILPRSGTVLIISDCRSAIDVATSCGGQCPTLSLQCTEIIRHLRSLGMYVEFAWISFHMGNILLFFNLRHCVPNLICVFGMIPLTAKPNCVCGASWRDHSGKPGMRNVKLPWSGRFLPSDFVLSWSPVPRALDVLTDL